MPEYTTPGVYVEETRGPRSIAGVATSTAAFLGATARGPLRPTLVTSVEDYVSRYGDDTAPDSHMQASVRGFFDNGGHRLFIARTVGNDGQAGPLDATDFEGQPAGARAEPQGLAALSDQDFEEVAVVYAPGASFDVARALVRHCEGLRHRFAIIDGPAEPAADFDPRAAVGDSSYAAIYVPWLLVADPKQDTEARCVPPGGYVAGLYARMDSQRGVHRAPANETVIGAVGLTAALDTARQARLNPIGVNVIREFAEAGRHIRVWGARTLSSDPDLKYINVRRLLIYLEHSIERGVQWAAFEPNNEQLWARIRQAVDSFLMFHWKDGALQGSAPDEAFFVRCDRTTMTQDDITHGRLVCEIGVAIVKPAEFVNFRVQQETAG